MSIRALSVILANAGILFIAYQVGSLNGGMYGFSCTYAKWPVGSACNSHEGVIAFWEGFVPAAAILYVVWGLGFAARKLMKAK
jgi:hypothetical protein